MGNNVLVRDLGKVDFEAGQTKTFDLPRSHYYQRLNLVLDYDITVNTADTPSHKNGVLELIDNIKVEFNSNKSLKSTSLATSHLIDWYNYGNRPVFDALDFSTASDQTGQIQTFVDFLVAPGEYGTMFPSFAASDLSLKISWGTDASIADDVSINDASVRIQSEERLKNSVAKKPSEMVKMLNGFKETEHRKQISQTGETTIKLQPGNVFAGIPLEVIDNNAPSNSLVKSVSLVEDTVDTHKDSAFDLLRAKDAQQYGLNYHSLPDGFAYVNYALKGDLSDAISTQGYDSYEMVVDTDQTAPTGTAEVRYVTQEIVVD